MKNLTIYSKATPLLYAYEALVVELDKVMPGISWGLTTKDEGTFGQVVQLVGFDDKANKVFALERKFELNSLENRLLEIDPKFQGKGISALVNRVGVEQLEKRGAYSIKVSANLDMGAYTWLRKGFVPTEASWKAMLEEMKWLAEAPDYMIAKLESLSIKQLQAFARTDEFRKYKVALKDMSWEGEADIRDPVVRKLLTEIPKPKEPKNATKTPPKKKDEAKVAAAKKAPVRAVTTAPAFKGTANEQLFDAMVRHQTYLLRHSSHVRNRIINLLNATEDDLARRIRDKLLNNKGLTTPVEWRRLQSLLDTIRGIRGKAWDEANKLWLDESVQLAYQEPIFFKGMINATSPVIIETVMPSARLLKNIVMSRPFQGRVMKEWASTMQAEDLRRISNAVQMGMVAGEDSATIARRVVGTGALKGADGMTQLTRRQVQAITRTAVSHISNNARSEFLQENSDILDREQFVGTLDARTTPVCRAMDGEIFPLGKGPIPPLHYQCRSLRVAAFNAERMGDRPANASTKKQLLREYAEKNNLGSIATRDDLPRGTKGDFDKFSRARVRELTGTVPASTTYQKWLERQSTQFQDDTLGPTKAKLFRNGGLKLDRFIDNNGQELSLKEIAIRDADAFRAAGLDPDKFK